MNTRQIVTSALASAFALGLAGNAAAQDKTKEMTKDSAKNKEKCYGISKAGQNDCANTAGTHSCAGQSKADNSPEDWKYVAAGTCKEMKGMTEAEAKMKTKKG
jgi:uncharacterized membrane protein